MEVSAFVGFEDVEGGALPAGGAVGSLAFRSSAGQKPRITNSNLAVYSIDEATSGSLIRVEIACSPLGKDQGS